MNNSVIEIVNSNSIPQKFVVKEYKDGMEIIRYDSNKIDAIEIPKYINKKPVIKIGNGCFFNHPEINSILFPETLQVIGYEAFALCSRIKELNLPDSVTEIGFRAFRDCKGLKRIVLPKHLKVLRAGVFSFCYFNSDVEIILPEQLEEIEAHAFYSGGSFELVLPDSVKKIGVGAFNWGPKVITSLPHDKGWYLDWPYGEEVVLKNGKVGKVSDLTELDDGSAILEVNVSNEKTTIFFPCLNGLDYHFVNPHNQKLMEDFINSNEDLKKTYELWRDGLI